MHQKRSKKPKSDPTKLTNYEYLEITEYPHEERLSLFTEAIYNMWSDGILSSTEAKQYLNKINQWLLEEFEG